MPGNPLSDPTWATTAADTIERYVGLVREKGTDKIVLAARGVVYGLIIAFGAVASVVLLLIILTRGLQSIFDTFLDHSTSVWLSYLVVGGIMCLGGALSMTKRHVPDA